MFESTQKLGDDIGRVLAAIRAQAQGRYACLLEAKGILFEDPEPEDRESWALRRLLEERRTTLLAIPRGMASGEPIEDVFAGWDHDELFLAVLNERVALVVACPRAESLKERALPPLKVLADRLLRYDASYRMDSRGRGFFFGRPKLDLVVIGRAKTEGQAP